MNPLKSIFYWLSVTLTFTVGLTIECTLHVFAFIIDAGNVVLEFLEYLDDTLDAWYRGD